MLQDFEKALLAEFLRTYMTEFAEIAQKHGLPGNTVAHEILKRLEKERNHV
ncbi:hypothetical protein [Neisseria musculi]|uniref:Uncharacterized protein n=1 Tax=Neisseria musculi TaxID=1815583 RepID=A0A7H1MBI2_9NEIS|nr:hypothetical protein [Neisseria musculi]QNT58997.1 hypothetical protein H7A79_1137 [Neisseria musculi]